MWRRYPYIERERLKQIKCPTLIIAGDRDFIPQQQTIHIQQLIPGVQLMIVPGAGHGTFRDRPELMNLALIEFLDAPGKSPSGLIGARRGALRERDAGAAREDSLDGERHPSTPSLRFRTFEAKRVTVG